MFVKYLIIRVRILTSVSPCPRCSLRCLDTSLSTSQHYFPPSQEILSDKWVQLQRRITWPTPANQRPAHTWLTSESKLWDREILVVIVGCSDTSREKLEAALFYSLVFDSVHISFCVIILKEAIHLMKCSCNLYFYKKHLISF